MTKEKTFGSLVREARKTQNLKQYELAKKVGMAPEDISGIETDRGIPSVEKLDGIVKYLDLNQKYCHALYATYLLKKHFPVDEIPEILETLKVHFSLK